MSHRAQAKSDLLLERFVASLENRWAPVKCATDPRQIDALYAKLPARFPPLYERLVLSYAGKKLTFDPVRCWQILPDLTSTDSFLKSVAIRHCGRGCREAVTSSLARDLGEIMTLFAST